MEERGIRDQVVVATKVCSPNLSLLYRMDPHHPCFFFPFQYTNSMKRGDPTIKQQPNYVGNNLKSMRTSLEQSLKNLRTDYIDIFYIHFWDLHTSVEEAMDGLHQLVLAGKVLYLVSTIPPPHPPRFRV